MNSTCFYQTFTNFGTVGIEVFWYDCLYLLEKWCAVAFKLDFSYFMNSDLAAILNIPFLARKGTVKNLGKHG